MRSLTKTLPRPYWIGGYILYLSVLPGIAAAGVMVLTGWSMKTTILVALAIGLPLLNLRHHWMAGVRIAAPFWRGTAIWCALAFVTGMILRFVPL
jgi:hypothetical protein